MDLQEYKKIIGKTAVYPKKVGNFGLAYSFLGVLDESVEAREAFEIYLNDKRPDKLKALKKEIGDVCWYITSIAVLENLDMDSIFDLTREYNEDLERFPSIEKYAGNIKKFYRDNKAIDKKEIEGVLSLLINSIMLSAGLYDIKLDEVLELNYEKLIKRRETNTIHGDGDNREEN